MDMDDVAITIMRWGIAAILWAIAIFILSKAF